MIEIPDFYFEVLIVAHFKATIAYRIKLQVLYMYNDNSPRHFHRIIACISTTPKAAAGYPRRNISFKYLAKFEPDHAKGLEIDLV